MRLLWLVPVALVAVFVIARLQVEPPLLMDQPRLGLERFRDAPSWTLHALEPLPDGGSSGGRYGEWTETATARLEDAEARARLRQALRLDPRFVGEDVMTCFEPHHGLSATIDGDTTTIVPCFQCDLAFVYGPNRERSHGLVLLDTGHRAFDDVFSSAGLVVVPAD